MDTHTFLWLFEGSPRLSAAAQAALSDPAHDLWLSVASVWESVIKTSTRKLLLYSPVDVFIHHWTERTRFPCCLSMSNMHSRWPDCRIIIATRSTES